MSGFPSMGRCICAIAWWPCAADRHTAHRSSPAPCRRQYHGCCRLVSICDADWSLSAGNPLPQGALCILVRPLLPARAVLPWRWHASDVDAHAGHLGCPACHLQSRHETEAWTARPPRLCCPSPPGPTPVSFSCATRCRPPSQRSGRSLQLPAGPPLPGLLPAEAVLSRSPACERMPRSGLQSQSNKVAFSLPVSDYFAGQSSLCLSSMCSDCSQPNFHS